MKEDVLIKIVEMICLGYVDTILTGIEEQECRFPYTIACANFMSDLKEKIYYLTLIPYSLTQSVINYLKKQVIIW